MKENRETDYVELADYLSDHLWMVNSLDFEFLKEFPEFLYEGIGYRVLFLNEQETYQENNVYKSFAKTLSGARQFHEHSIHYDRDFVEGRKPILMSGKIVGFDLQRALEYFKSIGGLHEKTINTFIGEEEVICFSHELLEAIKFPEF